MPCKVKHLCLKVTYISSWIISIGLIVLGYRIGSNPSCSAPKAYMCYNNQSGKLVCCGKQEDCMPITVDCTSAVTDLGTYVVVVGLLILSIDALIGFCYLKHRYCSPPDRHLRIDSNM